MHRRLVLKYYISKYYQNIFRNPIKFIPIKIKHTTYLTILIIILQLLLDYEFYYLYRYSIISHYFKFPMTIL